MCSPGLPLKIARPDLTIDLVEATAKKASFLKEAVRRLGLSGMNVIPVYLGKEPAALPPEVSWDFFVSRGVKLEAVLRAVKPFWGPAQRLLLMKGPDWREEIEKLGPLLKKLQIVVERTILSANPLAARKGVLVILWKTRRSGELTMSYVPYRKTSIVTDPSRIYFFLCCLVTRRWQALELDSPTSTFSRQPERS